MHRKGLQGYVPRLQKSEFWRYRAFHPSYICSSTKIAASTRGTEVLEIGETLMNRESFPQIGWGRRGSRERRHERSIQECSRLHMTACAQQNGGMTVLHEPFYGSSPI